MPDRDHHIVVAASDAPAGAQSAATWGCDGTADNVQIQAAIDATTTDGGTVELTTGTFYISSPIAPKSNVTLRGQGEGTVIKLADNANCKIFYQADSISSVGIENLAIDGNKSNQADVLEANRNNVSGINLVSVTVLRLTDLFFADVTSGAALLLQSCTDVRMRGMRFQTDGKTVAGAHTALCDHVYIGDCFGVDIEGFYAETCTDTGIAIEGSQHVKVQGYTIRNIGSEAQGIAVSTSASKQSAGSYDAHVVIGAGTIVGKSGAAASDTYGIRVGLFGQASVVPSNIQIGPVNISGVDRGISIDEGARVDITGPQIKIHSSATVYQGYNLGAGSTLVNIAGGRVQNGLVGVNFVASSGKLNATGLDVSACVAPIAGTPAAGTKALNCPGWVTTNSGATSVADAGTVEHGLVAAPTRVNVTPTTASEMASVTAVAATTFTVALKKHDNSAGTTQTVYWQAEKVY